MVLDLNLPPEEGDGEVVLEDEEEWHHVHEVNNQDLQPLDLNSAAPEEEEMHPGYIFVITIVLPM